MLEEGYLLMATVCPLARRLVSVSQSMRQRLSPTSSIKGDHYHFSSNISSKYSMAIMARRGIVTEISSTLQSSSDKAEDDKDEKSVKVAAANSIAFANLKTSKHHDLAMVFTCKVCETRSMKTMCRASYEKGVVVARCGGCNNFHLIADHLGWFGEPGTIEDLLASRGEEVKRGSEDTLNLTLEDIVGEKQFKNGGEAIQIAAGVSV